MEKLRKLVNEISDILIVIVTFIIIGAIVIDGIDLAKELIRFVSHSEYSFTREFSSFLGNALTLVIGLEFVKMLLHHSPDLVIEILIYTIARSMVVHHPDSLSVLLGVLAIALLFGIRRFLLIKGLDISPENALPETIQAALQHRLDIAAKEKEQRDRAKTNHSHVRIHPTSLFRKMTSVKSWKRKK